MISIAMIKKLITFAALVPFMASSGSYTANHSSVVTWVKIYNNNVIYFGVETMPANATCSGGYFTLDHGLTEKQLDRYYSMLLTARAAKSLVSIGYDKDSPDCYSNIQKVHALSL